MSPARSSLRVLPGALALAACVAQAQAPLPQQSAPWVQVEVVVFRHLDTTLAADEAWPAAPALSWPDPLQFLLVPGSAAHSATLAAREFDQALAAEEGSASRPAPVEEMPYLRLAGADTVLADRAARLRTASSYRLLDHLAWRQPLPDPARPVSVLITAGTQTGTHYEVEGYLTLTRARYLHADVTLWLNELSASAGTDALLLPEVPLPQEPALPPQEGSFPAPQDSPTEGQELPGEALEALPVRSTRTVVLHTARRLAAGEVNYLDHPLFGVLLLARAWDPATGAAVSGEESTAPPPGGAEETPPPEGAEETPPPAGAEATPPPD